MTGYLTKLLDYSDEIALCFDNGNYSYKELNDRINYFFNGLKDIKSGQVVCIISDYSFEAISLFFALVKNKNIIVPIVSENREEVEKRLDVVSPDVVINLREETLVIFLTIMLVLTQGIH